VRTVVPSSSAGKRKAEPEQTSHENRDLPVPGELPHRTRL
jgi:hypothetical protein